MKKWISILIIFVMVFMFTGHSWAEEHVAKDAMGNVQSFMKWNDDFTILLKTGAKQTVLHSKMMNSRYMIPFRQTFGNLGSTVSNIDSSLLAVTNNKLVFVYANQAKAVIDNRTVTLDHENMPFNNDLLVSLRVLVESYPTDIDWDAEKRTLTIKILDNGAPFQVKSPAVVPDSFLHWGIMNLNPSVTQLDEGISNTIKIPSGSFEPAPYFGPAPPPLSGDYYYKVTVYALDTDQIKSFKIATFPAYKEDFETPIKDHIIGRAVSTFFYQK